MSYLIALEPLDSRKLMAAVTGTVWTDADASTTYDADESAVGSAVVYVDANANGRYDTGEPRTTSDAAGQYSFKDLAAGDYLVGVAPPAGQGRTTPGPKGTVKGGFDIDLTGTDALTAVERRAFAAAAARWESIITGDLPDVGGVDDVRISVTIDKIDGPGGTLAQAGPSRYRSGGLPYRGDMEFDRDDVQDLIDEGHFVDTVTHEMAHVLGFGTVWADLGLLDGEGGRNPRFLGGQATAAYNKLFKRNLNSVPVESRGGDGTADSHWPEAGFAEELMTGYTENAATAEPISRVTVGQFADIGYDVNMNAADVWNPLTHTTTLTTPLDLGGKPFERRVTVGKNGTADGVDFGLRADTAPAIGRLTAGTATLGDAVTLSASKITDAEGDAVVAVGFYGESNGVAGLQGGKGGDTFLGTAGSARQGAWTIDAPTAGLAAGGQAYYAVATDSLGLGGRRGTTGTLTAPPPPTRPNPVVATRQSRTATLLQWKDRAADEIGFRIQIATDPAYADVLRTFNVPAGSVSSLLAGLTHGTSYYVRIRAYGYGGASAYTRLSGVRV